MKKQNLLISLILIASLYVKAQTNIFPDSGNVGIGTTTPTEKLQIENGLVKIKTNSNSKRFIWSRTDNTMIAGLAGDGARKMFFVADNLVQMTLDGNNGNLGIGINSPLYGLHVKNGAQLRKTTIGITIGSNENSWIRDEWLTGNYGPVKWKQDISKWVRPSGTYNDIGGIIYQDEGTYFLREKAGTKLEYTNKELLNTAYMFVNMFSKNVGIGTVTPDAKLTVKGNIHTQEVKVDLLGAIAPDYVFYKDYDLKTLKEVETYIAKEGHLPNIPSAETMEAEGINLKAMNLKLLEKIEELTLYTIDQEKRIDNLETENTKLKRQDARIKQLEERLALLLNNK